LADKTTTGRLIAAVGGVLLIVSLFLSWYGINVSGDAAQFATAFDNSFSGWQSLDIGDFVFFIVGLLAIAPAALDIFDLEIELPFDVGFVALIGGAISLAWIILRIIDKPGPDIPDVAGLNVGIGVKFGIFVALIGAALIVFGGFRQQQEDDEGPTFTDPVSGQQYATPQAPPPAAPPPAAAPPAAAPPAQAPPPAEPPQPQAPPPAATPQAPPPAGPPQPPAPPAPPAV
jgi:drug/metabolite transporter superfamily protein YnfA